MAIATNLLLVLKIAQVFFPYTLCPGGSMSISLSFSNSYSTNKWVCTLALTSSNWKTKSCPRPCQWVVQPEPSSLAGRVCTDPLLCLLNLLLFQEAALMLPGTLLPVAESCGNYQHTMCRTAVSHHLYRCVAC